MNICNTKNKFNIKILKKDLNNIIFFFKEIIIFFKDLIYFTFDMILEIILFYKKTILLYGFLFIISFITFILAISKVIDLIIGIEYNEIILFSFILTSEFFSIFSLISLIIYSCIGCFLLKKHICKKYF